MRRLPGHVCPLLQGLLAAVRGSLGATVQLGNTESLGIVKWPKPVMRAPAPEYHPGMGLALLKHAALALAATVRADVYALVTLLLFNTRS